MRRAERAVAAVALLAAGLAPSLVIGGLIQAFVYGACCSSVVALGLIRAGWLGAGQRLTGATWHADGRWTLSRSGQPPLEAMLLGDSRYTAGCVWLHWQTATFRRRSMVLTKLDLPAGQLRRLVVRLRLQGATGAASAARVAL